MDRVYTGVQAEMVEGLLEVGHVGRHFSADAVAPEPVEGEQNLLRDRQHRPPHARQVHLLQHMVNSKVSAWGIQNR